MARLSAVLGGILAEFSRARLISDRMTKELVSEYEDDPIMSSFSIPRIAMRDVDLTLRFSVKDVQEAEPKTLSPTEMLNEWNTFATDKTFTKVLTTAKVAPQDVKVISDTMAKHEIAPFSTATATDTRYAINGNTARLVTKSVAPVMEVFAKLPPQTRKRLGGKAGFLRTYGTAMRTAVSDFFTHQNELKTIEAALLSNIDVSVVSDELERSGEQIHELHLSLRGEDLEIIQPDTIHEEETNDDH